MVEYDLALCYGVIVSFDKIQELEEVLTAEEFDEVFESYSRCLNQWTNEDYFIGTYTELNQNGVDFVYPITELSAPSSDDKDLIDFKQFFDEHNLGKLIDWKPKLMLINFCY